LALEVAGRPDVSIDLSTSGDDKYNTEALKKLKEQTIVIKEGTEYRLKVVFKWF
jgi:predicted transcriptional regulator